MTAAALGTVIRAADPRRGTEDRRPGGHPERQRADPARARCGRPQRSGRGDLHVHIDVVTPTKLDTAQRGELIEQLAVLRDEEHVEPSVAEHPTGLFSPYQGGVQREMTAPLFYVDEVDDSGSVVLRGTKPGTCPRRCGSPSGNRVPVGDGRGRPARCVVHGVHRGGSCWPSRAWMICPRPGL